MRRKWLLIGIGLLTAVLAIGTIACGGGDDDDALDELFDEILEELGDDLGILQLVATLEEVDGSGASGVADISINEEGILVGIVMEGLSEGVHANHIHDGSCEEQGDIHITLDQIVADGAGDGRQTTGNNEESLSHFETGHYLAVHAEDDETVGAVVACGNVVAP